MNSAVLPSRDRSRPRAPATAEAERLIRAYPVISADELKRLVEIFPRLPVLDVGLMTADETLAPRLEAFHQDHGRKIKMPVPHLLLLLSVPAIFVAIIVWAIMFG